MMNRARCRLGCRLRIRPIRSRRPFSVAAAHLTVPAGQEHDALDQSLWGCSFGMASINDVARMASERPEVTEGEGYRQPHVVRQWQGVRVGTSLQ